ncbi:MAG: hypothetical protein AABZ60_12055, partial [Planctomycetota bacterium]
MRLIGLLFFLMTYGYTENLHWIFLKNGQQIEGKIIKETETLVVVSTEQGKAILFLPKNDILKIQVSLESPQDFLQQSTQYLEENRLEDAEETLLFGLKRYPHQEELLEFYIRILLNRGDLEKTIPLLT